MKLDRLLGITVYLMNRETVTARELAQRFEVSPRTIVRDMEALGVAGIPVVSSLGAGGGYGILHSFRLKKQLVTASDYQNILTSLRLMCSARENWEMETTLEKFLSGGTDGGNQHIFMDFSHCREGDCIPSYLRLLEKAIARKQVVKFDYTDASGKAGRRSVEPLALTYRWYAWYLFAWCRERADYRIFKLIRMGGLCPETEVFTADHPDVPELLDAQWNRQCQLPTTVKLRCRAPLRVAVREYLGGRVVEELENGDCIFAIAANVEERMWFSLLLGFGDGVEVLEPLSLREQILQKSRELFSIYDTQLS